MNDENIAKKEAMLAAFEERKKQLEYNIADIDNDNSLSDEFASVHYFEIMRSLVLGGSTALLTGFSSYVLTENTGLTAILSMTVLGTVMAGPKLYQCRKVKLYQKESLEANNIH